MNGSDPEMRTIRTGVPVLGAAFDAARAQSSTATNFRVVATDTASGGAFTLGG
ncbi:hypothetical protein GCM10017691_34720 [Pseudonocardia petroleophila]|uniref:Uncharacterized protein n=1 Tax=Pseudonocardia petroleophila TaxID=37331 RepID=A0A7G7MD84_9PSEU|nr:hypothetical protein [Pseudonocardia petroleophila]QNG50745.1 hypothetical protein H6H00_21365 [Pseudonocardia petroleophila]